MPTKRLFLAACATLALGIADSGETKEFITREINPTLANFRLVDAHNIGFFLPADSTEPMGACPRDMFEREIKPVVAHPDGKLGAYLDSLQRLHALAEAHEVTQVWPGHGPVIENALDALSYYLDHRQQRLDQVRAALDVLGRDAPPRAVVEHVYTDVDPVLWGAAELSVRAQLDYLRRRE